MTSLNDEPESQQIFLDIVPTNAHPVSRVQGEIDAQNQDEIFPSKRETILAFILSFSLNGVFMTYLARKKLTGNHEVSFSSYESPLGV